MRELRDRIAAALKPHDVWPIIEQDASGACLPTTRWGCDCGAEGQLPPHEPYRDDDAVLEVAHQHLADVVTAGLGLEVLWAVEVEYAGNLTEPYPTEAEARERAAEILSDDPEATARVVCRVQSQWKGVDD